MITSMTGYGRGVARSDGIEVLAEIRSVNNRYLDVVTKLPRQIAGYEQPVRDLLAKRLQRGRVSVWVNLTREGDSSQPLHLNIELVKAYLNLGKTLHQELGVEGELRVQEILSLPDVISTPAPETADEQVWAVAQQAIQTAIGQLVDMRQQEGINLALDFRQRIESLEQLLKDIETQAADQPQLELEKLRERVKKLIDSDSVDEGRLETELALIADRIDVTEECVRFHSHNKVFLQTLEMEPSQGRKLNFLLQEMHREANTVGSKTSLALVSHVVISIKDEIEKMREQVQNIE